MNQDTCIVGGRTLIEVRNLVKKYGDYVAVDHLNFTVEKGQIYGFLGPNGAGKSTTMNIMTGYLGATEGDVLINGHNILDEPEAAKKCIGYLPELPPLYVDMTVLEYLKFVAELKQVKKQDIEEAVDKVVELVKLEEVSHRLIQNLSKGYKQRVGLAGAVIGFPEVIILDEPTVGLDPKQIIEIRELIRELAKEHTIILSSHILAEVREVCDYILIISQGKLVASDTPDNLEHLVSGTQTIEIVVRATKEEAEKILNDVADISKIEYTQEGDVLNVLIETVGNKDLCEEISLAFAIQRKPLLKLNMSKTTLEDVFLELTQSEVPKPEDEDVLSDEDSENYEEIDETQETAKGGIEDDSNL